MGQTKLAKQNGDFKLISAKTKDTGFMNKQCIGEICVSMLHFNYKQWQCMTTDDVLTF